MNYRELLNYCKANPGCFSTNRQKKIEANIRYDEKIEKSNNNYQKK